MDLQDKLYTVEDVAGMTALTTRTIRNYLKSGILKGKKMGGQWRFTRDDIQSFMDNGQVVSTMVEEAKQAVIVFLDGVNTDVSGTVQVCTIIDLYTDDKTAKAVCDKITEYIGAKESGSPVKFDFSYDEKEGKARFTVFASPQMIARLMEFVS